MVCLVDDDELNLVLPNLDSDVWFGQVVVTEAEVGTGGENDATRTTKGDGEEQPVHGKNGKSSYRRLVVVVVGVVV